MELKLRKFVMQGNLQNKRLHKSPFITIYVKLEYFRKKKRELQTIEKILKVKRRKNICSRNSINSQEVFQTFDAGNFPL